MNCLCFFLKSYWRVFLFFQAMITLFLCVWRKMLLEKFYKRTWGLSWEKSKEFWSIQAYSSRSVFIIRVADPDPVIFEQWSLILRLNLLGRTRKVFWRSDRTKAESGSISQVGSGSTPPEIVSATLQHQHCKDRYRSYSNWKD